jgi:hypothetical protein
MQNGSDGASNRMVKHHIGGQAAKDSSRKKDTAGKKERKGPRENGGANQWVSLIITRRSLLHNTSAFLQGS